MTFHDMINIIGWICFFTILGTTLVVLITFVYEREWRAFYRGLFLLVIPAISYFLFMANYPSKELVIPLLLLIGTAIIFILIRPKSNNERLKIVGDQKRVDERDAFFHRFYRLKKATPEFETYYRMHPEKLELDEKIRSMPNLGKPGTTTFHPFTSLFHKAIFSSIGEFNKELDWIPKALNEFSTPINPEEITMRLKGFARYLGADLVGTTKLNPAYVYSHIGRSPGKWGEEINLNHKYAIVIAVEMKHEMIRLAPDSPEITETSFQYLESAKIALVLAKFINMMGYEARAHIDGNYRVLCVPVAVDAGIGELGRLGLLITKEFGPRVRLAIVSTNLPLIQDQPVHFGVQHFCSICKKCATACPSKSISSEEKKIYNGVEKWQSQQESCYQYWRRVGTDCGVCIRVCPYSNPSTFIHNIIRWLVQRNNFSRKMMFLGDDFFYGNRMKNRLKFPDWHNKGC